MNLSISNIAVLSAFIGVILLSACQTTSRNSGDTGSSDQTPQLSRAQTEGSKNVVLNNMNIGLNAFKSGEFELSRSSFDKVLASIETVYANSESAAKARSLWYEEGMKDFKGEPYERVMAYYYRGLLFLQNGDFENARAAFKSAIIQDSFKEEEQNRCNFALVIFLEGLASQWAGDNSLAEESFKELKIWRPDFTPPRKSNALIIAETGTAPRKVADGPGHSELKYRRGKEFTENKVEIIIDNSKPVMLYPMEDIYLQSTTRGERQIDKILKNKVIFQQSNINIGSTLTEASSIATMMSPLSNASGAIQIASGALGLVGAVQMYVAANAKPHADTRYWGNLPDTVHTYALTLTPGKHQITYRFKDKKGENLVELNHTETVEIQANSPSVIWHKVR